MSQCIALKKLYNVGFFNRVNVKTPLINLKK